MSEVRMEAMGDAGFRLSGELSFRTVPGLLRQSEGRFEGASRFLIDLQGVTQADSAGLALLLEWLRRCRTRRQDLQFKNLPENLLAIARVSNLEALFERLQA